MLHLNLPVTRVTYFFAMRVKGNEQFFKAGLNEKEQAQYPKFKWLQRDSNQVAVTYIGLSNLQLTNNRLYLTTEDSSVHTQNILYDCSLSSFWRTWQKILKLLQSTD